MAVNQADTFDRSPLFKEAQNHFQNGNWEAGLNILNKLVEKYPLDHNLRDYRQEMHLRSRVDEEEVVDIRKERRGRGLMYVLRLTLLGLLVVVLYFAWNTYSSWLIQQRQAAMINFEIVRQQLELTAKMQEAQKLLQAGRADEANALLDEVAAVKPDFPGLDVLRTPVNLLSTKEARYSEAIALVNEGDTARALPILEEIYSADPGYRDVATRIEEIRRIQVLDETLLQADVAFREERWTDAIVAYTDIRAIDSTFKSDHTEERLFYSYINAAEDLLNTPDSSLEDLEEAEVYFRKALALRPRNEEVLNKRKEVRGTFEERLFWSHVNAARAALVGKTDSLEALETAQSEYKKALDLRPGDPQVQLESDLAKNFLDAQSAFNLGDWDAAIEGLEFVAEKDPGYAMGVARHTLYEAYLARADSGFASGEFVESLEDYQRAAVLADQDQDSAMQLAEVQIKLGNVNGAIGNYEQAVQMYRVAIEVSDYRERIASENPALLSKIDEAESYAEGRNFRPAFRLYNEALQGIDQVYEVVVHKVVEGEYLNLLASRYKSTVSAILSVNDIKNANMIYVGQEILVPIVR